MSNAIFQAQRYKHTWTCRDQTGNVIDLSSESVTVKIRKPDGTESDGFGAIEDPVNGLVSYTWIEDELDVLGWWEAKPYLDGAQIPGTLYRFRVRGLWEA